jgi:Luciferase-like monooxygenase
VPGLRWGTLVLGQRYRNPALTARSAATLQHLTGGRFVLGLGAGDAAAEHRSYGYPFPPARGRVAQLAAFAAAGVRHMQLNFLDFPRSESLDLFLGEVPPLFDRAGT